MTAFLNAIHNVTAKRPVVHCITNYVTARDCANMLYACFSSPIMADAIEEAAEITAKSDALVLNLGTLQQSRLDVMLDSGLSANARGIPVVLDPVGVSASAFRKQAVHKLLKHVRFSVIRGNLSEIACLCGQSVNARGVDTGETNPALAISYCRQLSKQAGAVVVANGAIDCIASGDQTARIRNGAAQMARITGSGCMLSAVIGAYAAANKDRLFDAVTAAVLLYTIAGEIAAQNQTGIGSFGTALLDAVDLLHQKPDDILESRANYDVF